MWAARNPTSAALVEREQKALEEQVCALRVKETRFGASLLAAELQCRRG
jgi:hypothetical protein